MILSSNTLAGPLTVYARACAYAHVFVCACVRVCDEWAGARQCSLGGLGSICLSVSCQHCQWLTTSSTHSTSLFITTHVTHMRVRAQPSKHTKRTRTHTQDILFHYGRRPHWGQSGVGRQRGERERDGERDGWAQHKRWSTHASPASSFHSTFSLVHFRSLGIFLYFLFVFFAGLYIFWPPYIQWAQDFPHRLTSRSLPPLQAGMCVGVCVSQQPETLTQPLIRPIRTDTSPPPEAQLKGRKGFYWRQQG